MTTVVLTKKPLSNTKNTSNNTQTNVIDPPKYQPIEQTINQPVEQTIEQSGYKYIDQTPIEAKDDAHVEKLVVQPNPTFLINDVKQDMFKFSVYTPSGKQEYLDKLSVKWCLQSAEKKGSEWLFFNEKTWNYVVDLYNVKCRIGAIYEIKFNARTDLICCKNEQDLPIYVLVEYLFYMLKRAYLKICDATWENKAVVKRPLFQWDDTKGLYIGFYNAFVI